jgi:hypothetical protein
MLNSAIELDETLSEVTDELLRLISGGEGSAINPDGKP